MVRDIKRKGHAVCEQLDYQRAAVVWDVHSADSGQQDILYSCTVLTGSVGSTVQLHSADSG